uniref:(California timema) hypothetical protein n=1 Tax=Timema californicum TaxID=61474 RepID=A0A7R9PDI9_TIMCA|nr:unnamed protein product [Timema californicum]
MGSIRYSAILYPSIRFRELNILVSSIELRYIKSSAISKATMVSVIVTDGRARYGDIFLHFCLKIQRSLVNRDAPGSPHLFFLGSFKKEMLLDIPFQDKYFLNSFLTRRRVG